VGGLDGKARAAEAARVMPTIPAGLWPGTLPVVAACALALAGVLGLRGRREAWVPAAVAGAVAVGWVLAGGDLRTVAWPRNTVQALVLPALAIGAGVLAAPRIGRWGPALAMLFAAWWVGALPAARPEGVRLGAAMLVAAWAMQRAGATAPWRAAAGAAALVAGLASASPLWTAVGAVLLGAVAVLGVAGGRAAVPAGLPVLAVAGTAVGAGQLARGRFGLIEAVCLAALAAPFVQPRVEAALGRRLGRAAPVVAAAAAGGICAGLAWLVSRAVR
jgi:hypothetical protein